MSPMFPGSIATAVARLGAFLTFTLVMMVAQAVNTAVNRRKPLQMPRWYHRQCCRILGIVVERRGRQSRDHPTLYVSNHVSYLDVMILGGLIEGCFVAKSEVRSWPLFGWMARLQRTVFIQRRTARASQHRDEMLQRLDQNCNLILFPEGTSSAGNRVLPFKSALLSVAGHRRGDDLIKVQPVSLAYTRLDGLPLGRYLRPLFAWYGDMDLAPHIWQMAGLGRLTVVVRFHQPVTLEAFASRKALAHHCQAASARGVAAALSGRPMVEPAALQTLPA